MVLIYPVYQISRVKKMSFMDIWIWYLKTLFNNIWWTSRRCRYFHLHIVKKEHWDLRQINLIVAYVNSSKHITIMSVTLSHEWLQSALLEIELEIFYWCYKRKIKFSFETVFLCLYAVIYIYIWIDIGR